MRIRINVDESSYQLNVDEFDSVSAVMERIHTQFGVPAQFQKVRDRSQTYLLKAVFKLLRILSELA